MQGIGAIVEAWLNQRRPGAIDHDPFVATPVLAAALQRGIGYSGTRTPAETAVSIVAEIIAVRSSRSGAPLTRSLGKICG